MELLVLKYLLLDFNGSGAESGLVADDDERPPRAVTAAINLTGRTVMEEIGAMSVCSRGKETHQITALWNEFFHVLQC